MTLPTRIEAAEVPTRGVFKEAFDALHPPPKGKWVETAYIKMRERFSAMLDAEAWTSAAEMLLEPLQAKGWIIRISQIRFGMWLVEMWHGDKSFRETPNVSVIAAHPSLALLAAILRAERKDDE